ncbi:DMT family transporter [Jiella sp. MQZ9-1]|uniref:DMT family transporter n=1 Tax=Jiella flava TaxID=2816857 RepID=A0A939G1C9_9HYPH|nr:DMT family transporter [Jiella flava]MBO0664561.1 DMT family transporter [Jiella flava]MCD2473182.1 DMT family transporter [Jiella flava]
MSTSTTPAGKGYGAGVLFCLIATVAWGAMFPVMTHALKVIDPFTFTAMRYGLAGIVFVLFLLFREGPKALSLKGERWGLAWLCGTAGFAGFGFLVFLGQQMAGPEGALSASIMMATMPLLGLLVGWGLTGKRPPAVSFAFILMSFLGAAVVLTNGNLMSVINAPQNYSADLIIIFGAFCWVFYTIGATFFPHWSPYRYTAITTVLGMTSVLAVNFVLIAAGIISIPSAATVTTIAPHLAYMALVAGFVAVLCWNIGNKRITPMNGVLFMDVVPLTAFILSSLTGVLPSSMQILGAAITASALILNNLTQRARLARQASSAAAVKAGAGVGKVLPKAA